MSQRVLIFLNGFMLNYDWAIQIIRDTILDPLSHVTFGDT
jgi:hypothetical protein